MTERGTCAEPPSRSSLGALARNPAVAGVYGAFQETRGAAKIPPDPFRRAQEAGCALSTPPDPTSLDSTHKTREIDVRQAAVQILVVARHHSAGSAAASQKT